VRWLSTGLAVGAFGLLLTPATASASSQELSLCNTPDIAQTTVGGNGLHLTEPVFGGKLSLTAAPGAIPSGASVGVCTDAAKSNYPSDPIVAFFGLDVNGLAPQQRGEPPGPIHVVLRGPHLTPSSYLILQAGPEFRETNLMFQPGLLSFDARDFWTYAVYAHCPPFASCATTSTTRPPPAAPGDRRSALALTLPRPGITFRSPGRDLLNLALALVLLLCVTFPAELFNRTLDAHYEEIRAGFLARLHRGKRLHIRAPRDGLRRFAVVLLVGALLAGLLDPHAKFDLRTLMAVLGALLALVMISAVGALVEAWYRRRHERKEERRLHALPAGLVIAAACVLLSRLLSFQPGYLYGVIATVAFVTRLSRRHHGRIQALAHVAVLLVGVVAWLFWVPVDSHAAGASAGLGWVLLADALGAIFVASLVSSTIRLLPLRFLPGGDVASWHRGAWSALFGIAVFGMLAVMFNPNSATVHTGTSNWVTALVLLGCFGGGSFAFAGYFERRDRASQMRRRPPELSDAGGAVAPAASDK
jgi:hypothetical protein